MLLLHGLNVSRSFHACSVLIPISCCTSECCCHGLSPPCIALGGGSTFSFSLLLTSTTESRRSRSFQQSVSSENCSFGIPRKRSNLFPQSNTISILDRQEKQEKQESMEKKAYSFGIYPSLKHLFLYIVVRRLPKEANVALKSLGGLWGIYISVCT